MKDPLSCISECRPRKMVPVLYRRKHYSIRSFAWVKPMVLLWTSVYYKVQGTAKKWEAARLNHASIKPFVHVIIPSSVVKPGLRINVESKRLR